MGEEEIRHIEASLKERIKELECLYSISQISFEKQGHPLPDILKKIVNVLPKAWQFPEITHAHINFEHSHFYSDGFKKSGYRQKSPLIVRGKTEGFIEINYSKKMPDSDEGPFLKEERSLLNTIAAELSVIIDKKKQAEEKQVLEARLRHSDRLATIGEFSSGIAHELNEPLTTILGFAQLIKEDTENSQQVKSDIQKIIEASFYARDIVRKLMTFSKNDEREIKCVNLNQIIEKGIYLLESKCKKNNVNLIRLLAPGIPSFMANPVQIQQVIINLVVNSIQAMPDGGNIILQTSASKNKLILVVQDNGMGMSEKTLKRMYDPFYTTKDSRINTGLGLSVVHGIIDSLNGEIDVESNLGVGTRFEITFPIDLKKT